MITVLQIHIGDTSEREQYMKTVRDFAERNGHDYKLIDTIPADLKHLHVRNASDHLRMRVLSTEPYHFYLDSDVEIIAEKIAFTKLPQFYHHIDNAMYNGANLDLFARIHKKMIDKKGVPIAEDGIIYSAFAACVQEDYTEYLRNGGAAEFTYWKNEISEYRKWVQPRAALIHHGLTMNRR